MYLSRLEIVGFKSFANKVHLSFDAGITAIVGPNGCGKTNVVDAIRWALGEQKPSTLRSDKMEDVIFNGTKNRKPLGMADVSLTIENTKGILPSEYSEVTITRRVYRSGESEYYLNKTLCRLKDIKDLFMDTGMGSDAYSVIELKMVETILSEKADERRRLFEEAAGVTKYKHRRKEAYRRLDSVQLDLNRVSDIIKEVQKAVNSLERQANKAEQYNVLTGQLRTLELDLFEHEYAHLTEMIGPLQEKLVTARDEKNRINNTLSNEEKQLDLFRDKIGYLEQELSDAQIELNEQQQKINIAQQQRVKATERSKAQHEAIERYEKDKVDLRQQHSELEVRANEVKALIEETNKKVHDATLQYANKKEELDAFTVQLDAKTEEVKMHQESVIALLQEISTKRQTYERAKTRLENIHGRIEFSSEESDACAEQVKENTEAVARLSAEDKELRKQFIEAETRAQNQENYIAALRQDIESLKHNEFEARTQLERRRSRLDFLKSLVESYDGFSEGAKFLITSDEWKSNVQTTIADALSTKAEYRIAIESALGELASYIVVNNLEEAYRGIAFLKKNKKGRATFICLDKLPLSANHKSSLQGAGVVGWARDVVQCDEQYAALCDFLFSNTALVNDVESANTLMSTHTSLKCITIDGEFVTSEGILKGGSLRTEDGGMIGKKTQIAELEKEIAEYERQLSAIRKELSEKEHSLKTADVKLLHEQAKAVEQKMTGVEMRIAQIEYEKKRIEETIQRNATERVRLHEESLGLKKEIGELQPAIAALEEKKSVAEQRSGAAVSELETMEALWEQYSKVANEAHVTLLQLENDEKNFTRELEYSVATIKNIHSTLQERDVDIAQANTDIRKLLMELTENEHELSSLTVELKKIVERKKVVETEFNVKRNDMHSIELKIKDERRLHESSLSVSHELEMKISELTMKAQNLVLRAKEELEFELSLREYSVDDTFDIETVHEEVRQMKEKIRSLGAVNFAAFDEYKTEKERLEFITAQRDDLIESEKTLVQTIEEINATAQREFVETFEKIRGHFITTFKGLFDEGDDCDLRLEEGVEDPLEARIEITAKPRGKRPTSIDLLSGGEKTLTAIALLFAIYLVKPSPFCILDEVDAPLDDSNIDRFSRIIRKFSDNTQFIVVTHNKRTMEAANAMYGVTMEEQGISKLVSVRFNENKVRAN